MTYRARLRIELPDRPGALGQVGSVIGQLGGNVVAVDVQVVEGQRAVDEVVVDLPDSIRTHDLARALAGAGAGRLLGAAPGTVQADPVLRSLRWAAAMLGAGESGGDDEAERAIGEVCSTPNVWVTDIPNGRSVEVGRLVLARGRPVAVRSHDVPAELGPVAADEVWLLAAADARLDPRRLAFVARPVADRFTSTETERVEALLALRRLAEAVATSPPVVELV